MNPFYTLPQKHKKTVIGLMSGTSADGVDVALVDITGSGLTTEIELIVFETIPYKPEIRARIFDLFNVETARVDDICEMNFMLGSLFAESTLAVLEKSGVSPTQVDLIGSHGQTIHHMPSASTPATLQIGEPAVIAHETGIPTIADFRVADIAAGGEGAPLIAYPDYLLFHSPTQTIGLLNIGGISNLTVLPAGKGIEAVHASDTGPGNMILDACVEKITAGAKHYDENGNLARKGTVCKPLLDKWLAHPFFELTPPKTTGREMFGTTFADNCWQQIQTHGISEFDGLATVTTFTVESISRYYTDFVVGNSPLDILYVSGGGAQNPLIMEGLAKKFHPIPVVDIAEKGLSGDAKEAIGFAILANEAVHGNFANVPNATGATCRKVLGKFVYP
ncbi:anhydro-N-acetylmuramic acid kinase [Candidatus Poribacteria bacterium]|nr:anhydro-N-acetylmuramic acid kinase [Candidatus Poribacteria bacterium]MYB65091.1 anhydro-N-acetylmuramic acid kinase [Candidatus Poribacteria bacterium]MYF56358.1 anhydro-N-acetylmuramic acid kinase [Candidatus Poribacteria bacterium]